MFTYLRTIIYDDQFKQNYKILKMDSFRLLLLEYLNEAKLRQHHPGTIKKKKKDLFISSVGNIYP